MARYRSKDSVDLAWNDLRRRLTLQVDAEVRMVRENILNRVLTGAWQEFQKSLERGEVLRLESEVAAFVSATMAQSVDPTAEELEAVVTDAQKD